MDYSSYPSDPENPAGPSPWQSSPQPTRKSTFNGSDAASEPPSPTAQQRHVAGSQRYSADSDDQGQRSMGASSQSLEPSVEAQGHAQPQSVSNSQERGTTQQQSRQPQQQQHRPNQPSRYHGAVQQRQRQNAPQYRLTAKVTGLERSGRKDPVIKFDVHVRRAFPLPMNKTYAISDKPPQIQNHSIPRYPPHPFRILEARQPPDLFQPRSSCPRTPSRTDLCRYGYGRR